MPAQIESARVTLFVTAMSATTGRSCEMCATDESFASLANSARVSSSAVAPSTSRRSARCSRPRTDLRPALSACTMTRTRSPRKLCRSEERVGNR